MTREAILEDVDRDLACAVALGIVEYPRVIALLDAVTVHDAAMRPICTQRDWLDGTDPLDVATREYLMARREAMGAGAKKLGAGWAAAGAARQRDTAIIRANEAKAQGRALLIERGVLDRARTAGLKVFE